MRITGAFDQFCCMSHLNQARQHTPRPALAGPLSAWVRSYPAPTPLRHFSRSAPPPASATGRILFYDKDKPFYEFTNFSYHPVKYNGKSYPTSEHLFQAFKVTYSAASSACLGD
ncbi:hypothetical protein DXG03_002506 [Asterophora parasitica]|uniref:Uncharacterized protein n=1 Tax=Asterophora parasitica TaxID=117018 RepID=A0A9P7G2W2_9AGAR|nr:hypothetical protein DXG03_002506 [Asterophora parasitica]